MSKKKIYIIIGAVVALIIVLITLSKTGIIGKNDNAIEVDTAKANEITIIETVSATGKIQPEIEVKISSQVSGEIIDLPIKEGQVVKKGDLLVKINPDLYTSGLNRSISNYAGTEVEVDVNENDIVKINIGDETKIQVDAYLKKEFKGVVTSISNSASSATSADQVTNFKVKVRILKESYQDLIEGKPETYSPFRPGMTATVDIITKRKVNVIGIPISSVVIKSDTTATPKIEVSDSGDKVKSKSDKKLECVFVKVGDKAKIRIVKTGIQDDTNIEILSGLKKGDEVITGPYVTVSKDLNSGDKVKLASLKEKSK